jgi:hypothetical protein
MNKFNFRVADYKRISQMFFWMAISIIPLLFLSFFFIRNLSDITIIVSGLIILGIFVVVYLSLIKYYLVYDSEFTLDDEGIKERNLKTGNEMYYRWSDVNTFKFGKTKHTAENKDYLTLTFKSSNHTISVSEYRDDYRKLEIFNNFIIQIENNLKLHDII